MEISAHRPRNVGWARAAALLYGDWGTSKAYVIGLASAIVVDSSFWLIVSIRLLIRSATLHKYQQTFEHFRLTPEG